MAELHDKQNIEIPSCLSWARKISKYVSEITSGPGSNEFKLNHCLPSLRIVNQWSL